MSDPGAPPDHPDQRWTPAYQPRPAAPVAPAAWPQDPRGLAIAAYSLAVVTAVLTVAGCLSTIAIATQLDTRTYDNLPLALVLGDVGLGLLGFLTLLAAWIVTGIWLLRARDNAAVLAPDARHKRGRLWGVWGWVTPIVSLWFPMQYVRDLRRAGQGYLPDHSPVVGWWWAAWLVSTVLERALARTFDDATAADPGVGGGPVVVLAWLLLVTQVVAVTLWGLIVRRIVVDQTALAVTRASAYRPGPAPA